MLCSKLRSPTAIALIVMFMSMGIKNLEYSYSFEESVTGVQGLQMTATLSLLFGIFKGHPAHKAYFMLFWLFLTFFLLTFLIYSEFYVVYRYGFRFGKRYHLMSVLLSAGVALMMSLMYKEYVKLTQGPEEPAEEEEKYKQKPMYEANLASVIIPEKF